MKREILIVSALLLLPAVFYAQADSASSKPAPTAQADQGPSLETFKDFLLLDNPDGRHIVVLRKSLVDSLAKDGSSFDTSAATTAGILYAARDGNTHDKNQLAAAGDNVAKRAGVRQFTRLSELFKDSLTPPKDWEDIPVVVVFWQDSAN
jgi:hypothetical protein